MPVDSLITNHYTHGSLLHSIRDGVKALGKTVDTIHIDDLGPVDEFHIGGRIATQSFLDQLDIDAIHHVLDVGCGLGGSSRFAANRYGCRVTGVDLTQEYVETGKTLCSWVGLASQVTLDVADATTMSYQSDSFDRAFMMHVGMNIDDKERLASELYRVIRPGGRIGIYDIMRIEDGDLAFPVPWASEPAGSAVASPAAYKDALEGAGFSIIAQRNRRDFSLDFFAQLLARTAAAGAPPALGLHILMGSTAPVKLKNMMENISRNLVAPVEIIAEKAA